MFSKNHRVTKKGRKTEFFVKNWGNYKHILEFYFIKKEGDMQSPSIIILFFPFS